MTEDVESNVATLRATYAGVVAALENPKLDAKGNFGRYTSLGELSNHLRAPCAAARIAITQRVGGNEHGVSVTTVIVDADTGDELEVGSVSMPARDAQQLGAVTTYLRRFSLAAAFGIVGEPDDDGHTASKRPAKAATVTREAPNDGPSTVRPDGEISAAQLKALQTRWNATPRAERLAIWAERIGRPVASAKELTKREAITLLTEDDETLPGHV